MLPMRSLLFVPGDSERKLAKALGAGADALVLDLEDSVIFDRKPIARRMVCDFLGASSAARPKIWVRVNPLDSPMGLEDVVAVVSAKPDGILLPKCDGPEDVARLSHYLDILEIREGLDPGRIGIMPVVTETARGTLAVASYAGARLPRLSAMTWGAEDLSTALGASTNLGSDGRWTITYQIARSQCLIAAKACGAQAIETLFANYKDSDGLRASCIAARGEGFTGRFAIHPDQVATINDSFAPSPDEVANARRVIEAFASNPGAATIGLDGCMLDIPHLKQAQHTIALFDAFAVGQG